MNGWMEGREKGKKRWENDNDVRINIRTGQTQQKTKNPVLKTALLK